MPKAMPKFVAKAAEKGKGKSGEKPLPAFMQKKKKKKKGKKPY